MKSWNDIGSTYEDVWNGYGKKILSSLETSYIASVATHHAPSTVLDIGCGTGRIINTYIPLESITDIYAIDAASSMVRHCEQRFVSEKKVREVICARIAEQPFPAQQFDMISAIRVLKYNNSWRTMIKHITNRLKPNGILVCTMPNIHSITALWPDTVSYTTPTQFRTALEDAGLHVLDMRGFSKLPDKLHTYAKHRRSATLLRHAESFLSKELGSTVAARILFATCQKI